LGTRGRSLKNLKKKVFGKLIIRENERGKGLLPPKCFLKIKGRYGFNKGGKN